MEPVAGIPLDSLGELVSRVALGAVANLNNVGGGLGLAVRRPLALERFID